jgi:hypothetical protein
MGVYLAQEYNIPKISLLFEKAADFVKSYKN